MPELTINCGCSSRQPFEVLLEGSAVPLRISQHAFDREQ
jgi:hypothetical protein